jgi:hypothetical protein
MEKLQSAGAVDELQQCGPGLFVGTHSLRLLLVGEGVTGTQDA